ncbi:MAG TPA: hypothetical protein VIJ28_17075 [Chloroflexota bacterium]
MKARALLVFLALLCASMQYSHVAARTIPRAAQKPLVERFGIQPSDLPSGYSMRSTYDPGFANELSQTVLRETAPSPQYGNAIEIEITMWESAEDAGTVFADFTFANDGTGHYANRWNPGGVGDQEKGEGGTPAGDTVKTCLMGASSGYYLLFRRGSVLVLIQARGCKGGIDPAAISHVGRIIDGRIMRYLKSSHSQK